MSLSLLLRRELCERNQRYAAANGYLFVESYGSGVVVYEAKEGRHGNFLDSSYKAIVADPEWRKRLTKVHTARKALPQSPGCKRRELDSCTSSDALLMNVFCYPGTLREPRVRDLLGAPPDARPLFGFRARVPLIGDKLDRTEVDLKLDGLLVESKLTENSFQSKAKVTLEQYRDFAEVFDRRALPQTHEHYLSYQLIRNVLAAHALQASFCLLLDARRPDLLEAWHSVMRAVRPVELRLRCKTLTWQELAAVLPARLQGFLGRKYGIEPPAPGPRAW